MNRRVWYCALSMSALWGWLLYLPYYGPGSQALSVDFRDTSLLFTLGTTAGLLHSGWSNISPSKAVSNRWSEKASILAVGLISLLIVFRPVRAVPQALMVCFMVMGYAAGWIIIRWSMSFISPETDSRRGFIVGFVLLVANTLMYILTAISFAGDIGLYMSIIVSSILALAGGIVIVYTPLPVTPGAAAKVPLRGLLPPIELILFGVFVFFCGGLLYHSVFAVYLHLPKYLLFLVFLSYGIAGLLLGIWSDRSGSTHLATLSFIFMGLGLALWTLDSFSPGLTIPAVVLHLSGLACANIYYWSSLAETSNRTGSPFSFAVGLSISALMISLSVNSFVLGLLPLNSITSRPAVGVSGVLFIFLGLLVLTLIRHLSPIAQKAASPAVSNLTGEDNLASTIALENPAVNEPNPIVISIPRQLDSQKISQFFSTNYNLTPRECEIALLILYGYGNDHVSKIYKLSPNTVKYHTRNILRKVGVSNRLEMRKFIYEQFNEDHE